MKRKTLLTLCLLAAATMGTWAQGPNNSGTYYRNADGKSGAALKTAMHTIISKKTKSPSYDDLLELYKKTDTRADGYVRDWYSNITHFTHIKDKAGNYQKEGDVYNREHTVPQSWGAPKADIVHVVPTDGYVNNRRGNLPFGEVGTISYQSANGYSKKGSCKTAGYSGIVFEPNDEVKGDIARIYFYMATCYEGTCENWGNSVFTGTTYQPLAKWTYDMMMRWSKLDPVDDVERARNAAIYRSDVQGNRNPFVDYPGLEDYVWGDKKDVPFSYDNYEGGDIVITDRVAQPVFAPAAGTYTDQVEVTISTSTEGATIYYTTNGTEPSANSRVYDSPIILTSTTTVKAIAVKEGMSTSYQAEATYTIKKTNPDTPVTDADEMEFALNNSTFGSTASGSLTGANLHDYTVTKDGITVTYAKGSGSNMYMNSEHIRLYSGNNIIVSSAGRDIVGAEFTLVLNNGGKVMQCDTGTITDLVWTGNTQSVTFNVNSGSGHLRLSKLKVKLAPKPTPAEGDVTGDGKTDHADIAAIVKSIIEGAYNAKADLNGDERVDIGDVIKLIMMMSK